MVPIHFIAAQKPSARSIAAELIDRHGQADLGDASCVVAIGGDGTTLNALQAVLACPRIPVFSIRTPGSVGALGNRPSSDDLVGRLSASRRITIRPLKFEARTGDDRTWTGLAINEVAIIRSKFQAIRLRMRTRTSITDLFGDGLVIASAIGSTGYCRALGGPCLPYEAEMLALAGVAIRQPAEGVHLVVPSRDIIRLEVTDPAFRPALVETHTMRLPDVRELIVKADSETSLTLLLEDDEVRLARYRGD
jgi:NAD+ kinase